MDERGAERPGAGPGAAGHAALALPAVLLLGADLLAGRLTYLRDSASYFHPYRLLVARALREGRLPQWNPLAYEGHPLLADPNYSVFHPFAWLVALLPDERGLALALLAAALLGAYGAARLAGELGLGRAGRVVAGVCFAWSGPFVSLLQSGQVLALAATPWTVAAFAALARSPSAGAAAGAAAATALLLVSGTPELGACALLLAGVAVLATARTPLRARAAWSAGALLLGFALAMVQLAPTWRFLRQSTRAGGWSFAEATAFSLHPLRLLGVALPFAGGDPDAPGGRVWGALTGEGHPWVEERWAGLVALALAAVGAAAWRSRPARALAGASLALTVLALGATTPVSAALWRHLEWLRVMRYPEKLAIPLALAIALLAGAGWEKVRQAAPPGRRAWWAAPAAAGAALVALLAARPAGGFAAAAIASARLETALLLAALGCVEWGRRRPGTAPALALAAVLATDLLVPARRLHHAADAEEVLATPPVVALLRADAGSAPDWAWRVDAGSRLSEEDLARASAAPRTLQIHRLRHAALYGARPMLDGLHLARGYSGFTPGPMRALFGGAPGAEVLDLLGVRYAVEAGSGPGSPYAGAGFVPFAALEGPVRVWKNGDAGPKARVADAVLRGPAEGPLPRCAGREVAWLPAGDLAHLPEGLPTAERCADLPPSAGGGRAEILAYGPERVVLKAEAAAPALVVLNDAVDEGWRVAVDGRPARALAAGGALRALAVEAGTHEIEWTYRTPGLFGGAVVSAAGAAVLVALLLRARRARRPS